MVETSGLSKPTILKGIQELRGKGKLAAEEGRVRKPGGGRKPIEEHDPELTRLLEEVMDESTVGDPMSPLKWNSKSTYQIQQYLAAQGLAPGQPEGQGGRIPHRPRPAVSIFE
jgi:hypothetical protein